IVAEAKKTRGEAVDAQLRQLLLAGAAAAARRDVASGADAKAISLPLPPQVVEEGGKLSITPAKDGEKMIVHVTAEFARRRASQTLTFDREGESWKLANARLN